MDNHVKIIEIGGGWRIEDGEVRAFLFTGKDRAVLIDTGFGNIKNAVAQCTKLPVTLINTHADRDHVGGNAFFERAGMHPSEYAHYYEKVAADARVFPLWEGDIIDLGDRQFEVLLIPGHTPGSIALLDRENRILLSGDSVSKAPVYMFGQARNLSAYIESLEKLLSLRGCFDSIYPSHGPFPLEPDFILNQKRCALHLLAGELEGTAPPIDIPAQMFSSDGAAFYY